MVRIQDDLTLVEVLDRILADYAAEPPTTYKKQIRIQMRNEAMQSEAFCNEVEREIEDEFTGSPRLDEIEDFINEMPPTLAEILDRYDIRKLAKKVFQNKQDGGRGCEMSDIVYIVYSELLVDANDAETDIVGGLFYRDKEKAREKMVTVFNSTTEALQDEHDLQDCIVDIKGDRMVFSADGRVTLTMLVQSLYEGE